MAVKPNRLRNKVFMILLEGIVRSGVLNSRRHWTVLFAVCNSNYLDITFLVFIRSRSCLAICLSIKLPQVRAGRGFPTHVLAHLRARLGSLRGPSLQLSQPLPERLLAPAAAAGEKG